jgi:predicted RNA-binding protein with PUA-like domain
MNYWLVKSEPFKYSWEQFQKDRKTFWDGVRNYEARNNLRDMRVNDLVLFYHSNEGLEMVGVAKVVKESYPDPTSDEQQWLVVDLKPVKNLKRTLPLAEIKADAVLSQMQMIKRNRLSVTRVSADEYHRVMELTGTRP